MQKLIVYKTSDGKVHEDFCSAERHADNRYGEALISLAHQLLRIDKYKGMIDFLEGNLSEFVNVQKLKDDIKVSSDEEEED